MTYVFTNGSQSLIEALVERIDSNKICYAEPVQKIDYLEKKWKIQSDKRKLEADLIINTLPPNLFANKVIVEPSFSTQLKTVCTKTHTWMSDSIKIGLELDSSYWRTKEIGLVLSQFGPATELHDHNRGANEEKTPLLVGFSHPGLFAQMEDRKEKTIEQLSLYFPQSKVLSYYEKDWQADPFTHHPYPEEVAPHQYNGHELLRKSYFNRQFYFGGTESAVVFPGYMEGAVARAIEVVAQL